jgi:secreted protein with Ig-like and vWFA domain
MSAFLETAADIQAVLDTPGIDPDVRQQLEGRLQMRRRVERAGSVFALLPTPLDLDDEEDWP